MNKSYVLIRNLLIHFVYFKKPNMWVKCKYNLRAAEAL